MNPELEQRIRECFGSDVSVVSSQPVSGGCISQAQCLTLSNRQNIFVKTDSRASLNQFEAEAIGLRALSQVDAIRIPKVHFVGASQTEVMLALEWIQPSTKTPKRDELLGHGLAKLHQGTRSNQFGFEVDNFIGRTPQPNPWSQDWGKFFAEHRLQFQLRLARENGYGDRRFHRLGENLVDRIRTGMAEGERPCLIHGDLWSGNFLFDENQQPVLIDPAAYYADRESEFGMVVLFGGVSERFYEAYQEVFPLTYGYRERFEIYKLYHLLNHLNLFGDSYYSECLTILSKFG